LSFNSNQKALNHFYFKNLPRPTIPEKLPKAEVNGNGDAVNVTNTTAIKRKFEGDESIAKVSKRLFV
jgi:hypothetical protein